MSWDAIAMDFPANAKSVKEIPDNFKPRSLGNRTFLISKIKEIVPYANFSDPSWGIVEDDGWSIELSLGKEENCESVAFHVRGGEAAIGVVAGLLDHLGIRAVDCQTSEFFVADTSAIESFRKWRAFRDQIVQSYGQE